MPPARVLSVQIAYWAQSCGSSAPGCSMGVLPILLPWPAMSRAAWGRPHRTPGIVSAGLWQPQRFFWLAWGGASVLSPPAHWACQSPPAETRDTQNRAPLRHCGDSLPAPAPRGCTACVPPVSPPGRAYPLLLTHPSPVQPGLPCPDVCVFWHSDMVLRHPGMSAHAAGWPM